MISQSSSWTCFSNENIWHFHHSILKRLIAFLVSLQMIRWWWVYSLYHIEMIMVGSMSWEVAVKPKLRLLIRRVKKIMKNCTHKSWSWVLSNEKQMCGLLQILILKWHWFSLETYSRILKTLKTSSGTVTGLQTMHFTCTNTQAKHVMCY